MNLCDKKGGRRHAQRQQPYRAENPRSIYMYIYSACIVSPNSSFGALNAFYIYMCTALAYIIYMCILRTKTTTHTQFSHTYFSKESLQNRDCLLIVFSCFVFFVNVSSTRFVKTSYRNSGLCVCVFFHPCLQCVRPVQSCKYCCRVRWTRDASTRVVGNFG